MQYESTHPSVFALGRAQTPAEPRIGDDVAAIRELLDRIHRLWADLTPSSREELGGRTHSLGAAADSRDTSSKAVRETLQQVLIIMGTGALATLSEASRQRLAALTGIALPGHHAPSGQADGLSDDTGYAATPTDELGGTTGTALAASTGHLSAPSQEADSGNA